MFLKRVPLIMKNSCSATVRTPSRARSSKAALIPASGVENGSRSVLTSAVTCSTSRSVSSTCDVHSSTLSLLPPSASPPSASSGCPLSVSALEKTSATLLGTGLVLAGAFLPGTPFSFALFLPELLVCSLSSPPATSVSKEEFESFSSLAFVSSLMISCSGVKFLDSPISAK